MNKSIESCKIIFKTSAKIMVTFIMYPILKKFGYLEERRAPSNFPKSHYYQTATAYNHFVGLHSLPYSQAWITSKRENASINKENEFIPWITYPALDFLKKLTLNKLKVLEFGSGASTLWFANNCSVVKSYEFDLDYYHKIEKQVRTTNALIVNVASQSRSTQDGNLEQDYIPLLSNDRQQSDLDPEFWQYFNPAEFSKSVASEIQNADLIFIDGGPRNFLMGLASEGAKENTLIVVDNSDVEYVRLGIPNLLSKGYVEIPLSGPGPLNPYEWQTSIFIKSLESIRS